MLADIKGIFPFCSLRLGEAREKEVLLVESSREQFSGTGPQLILLIIKVI